MKVEDGGGDGNFAMTITVIVIMIMLVCLELLWQKDGVITAILSPLDDLSAGCGDGKRVGLSVPIIKWVELMDMDLKKGRCSNQFSLSIPRSFFTLEPLLASVFTGHGGELCQAVECL